MPPREAALPVACHEVRPSSTVIHQLERAHIVMVVDCVTLAVSVVITWSKQCGVPLGMVWLSTVITVPISVPYVKLCAAESIHMQRQVLT